MNKSNSATRIFRSNLQIYVFNIYLSIVLVFCLLPLSTGHFHFRTDFHKKMYLWAVHVGTHDIIINLLLYIPIGFLATNIALSRYGRLLAAIMALVTGTAISAGVEFVQYFITDRVSSSFDVFLNFISTGTGALLASIVVVNKRDKPD